MKTHKQTLQKIVIAILLTFCLVAAVVLVRNLVINTSNTLKHDKNAIEKVDSSVQEEQDTQNEDLTPVSMTLDKSKRYNGSAEALNAAIVPASTKEIKGHTLIASNDSYELYFKEESVSIIVRDKKTGSIMESTVSEDKVKGNNSWAGFMKSGIVLNVIKGTNVNPTTADIRKAKKEVTVTENGFRAKVYFDSYKVGFTVNVELTDDGFTAQIPNDSIIEDDVAQYTIGEIYVFPFMGYTKLGEREGYMFIPDGNGALIYLEDNEGRFVKSSFSSYVYGANIGIDESEVISLLWDEFETVNDSEFVLAPIIGMVHTDSGMGYLGIIEDGQYSAKIEAHPNGDYTDYNWITSKFILRQIYTQPTSNTSGSIVTLQKNRNQFDIKVRYCFTSSDKANYIGLAEKYRDYLISNDMITPTEDKFKLRMDFLGSDKEDWLIFKNSVTMTTVENIKEMFKELEESGVTDLLAIYKGWQKGGLYDLPITSYKADPAIGGTDELTDLINDSKKKGIDFFLAQDALRINPSTNNTTFNIVKKITKRVYSESTYGEVYDTFNFITPKRSKEILKDLTKSYKSDDVANVMLSGITNQIYSYSSAGKIYGRVDTAKAYDEMIGTMSKDMNLVLDEPFAYLWKYTDAIVDMPVTGSDYVYEDESIPFLSIVLKGSVPMYSDYVNFEANKQEYFLKLVEMGINPSFYITYEDPSELQNTNSANLYTSKFTVYKDNIVDYYNKLKEVNEAVQGAKITGHDRYDNNLTVVTYDNGVKIYINYGEKPINVNGMTIDAMSYKVGE